MENTTHWITFGWIHKSEIFTRDTIKRRAFHVRVWKSEIWEIRHMREIERNSFGSCRLLKHIHKCDVHVYGLQIKTSSAWVWDVDEVPSPSIFHFKGNSKFKFHSGFCMKCESYFFCVLREACMRRMNIVRNIKEKNHTKSISVLPMLRNWLFNTWQCVMGLRSVDGVVLVA